MTRLKYVADSGPYWLYFCSEDPEALCSSDQYKELRWVAGMASWIMRVQSYIQGEWGYIPELIKFVDGGMVDSKPGSSLSSDFSHCAYAHKQLSLHNPADAFIDAVSGILLRGCHDNSCGEVQPSTERTENFNMILDEIFNLRNLAVDNGRTYAPTMKPTRRTRKPIGPTPKPTKRPRPSASPTLEPTYETALFESVTGPPALLSEFEGGPLPTLEPTVWMPWYCK